VGTDQSEPRYPLDEFYLANLTAELPLPADRRFDVVLLADVLEHVPDPGQLLERARRRIDLGGTLLVSLPNAVHWSVRANVLFGKFDYTNKGLLDRGHLRFFTRSTATRLFEDAGLVVLSHRTTPIPWENIIPAAFGRVFRESLEKADHSLAQLTPNLFAYQHIFELAPS
jgi:SAM-dependent methyltransferase